VRALAGKPEDSAEQILQNSVDRTLKRALLLKDSKAQAGLGAPVGSPQQETGYTPPSDTSSDSSRTFESTDARVSSGSRHIWEGQSLESAREKRRPLVPRRS
jgi:hypothetical protein